MLNFGVVRFDSDNPNVGAWISVNGEKATRITSFGALDNQTIWWTNLSFGAIYSCNLHKVPYIKRTNYLNNWTQGGQEDVCYAWGIEPRRHTEPQIARALSAIFLRVMKFAAQNYGLSVSHLPAHDNLADELRCLMLPEKDPHISPEVDAALLSAHQYYSYCLSPRLSSEDYITVSFNVPAVKYAGMIMNSIIPSDQVEFVSELQLPAAPDRLNWVLSQSKPVLSKVRVSDIDPDHVNVISFGNGARAGTNRNWVSQPELLLLSQYARVEISSCFVFGNYQQLDPACRLPYFTTLQSMTPTADLICSNHWIGLCRENPYKLEANKAEYRALSPRAVWLNSFDRFFMFSYALQLHKAGIVVRRYGAGSVTVIVPKFNYRDAYEIATGIGLIAPPSLIPDILVQEELGGGHE